MGVRIPITVIEIDQDICQNTFGVAPCTASGEPCYNTLATCKDRPNYQRAATPLTLRFSMADRSDAFDQYVIPSVTGVTTSPTRINLGGRSGREGPLGVRASASIGLIDHPHSDLLVDPYVDQRAYDPLTRSTFWSKWLVRNPYHANWNLRILEGEAGQALANMITRHYVIESISGPDSGGGVQIRALDILRLADNDKAQAPRQSTGVLSSDLPSTSTTVFVTRAVLADYQRSSAIRIGDELIQYASITDLGAGNLQFNGCLRGQYNTEAQDHDADDTVQGCLEYNEAQAWAVAYDLLTEFADIDPALIPYSDWVSEGEDWLLLYPITNLITEPTGINDLLGELCEQCLMYIWWDEREQEIRLKAIAPTLGDSVAPVTDQNNLIAGSTSLRVRDEERATEVWVSFIPLNPTETSNEQKNFRRTRVRVDPTASSPDEYGDRRAYEIYSRWIRRDSQATTLTSRMLATYRDPPKYLSFDLDIKDTAVALLSAEVDITWRGFVDASGLVVPVRYRIISVHESPPGERIKVECVKSVFGIGKRYARIAPDATPDYGSATEEQRRRYMFIAADDGTIGGEVNPYLMI